MSDIDHDVARALGWPKAKYAWVERERRWLCDKVPRHLVKRSEALVDLYVTGTRLRLRRADPSDGSAAMLRLGRKADVTPSTRLLTSIYLSVEEYRLLSALPGQVLRKTRHYLGAIDGAVVSVDEFEGTLSGLIMAEAEFDDDDALRGWDPPTFFGREVTDDLGYTGGKLVLFGLPDQSAAQDAAD